MATGGRPGPCLTPDWKPTAAGIKLQVTVRKKKGDRMSDTMYLESRRFHVVEFVFPGR